MSFETFAKKYGDFSREAELIPKYERLYGKQSALHDRDADRRARFMQKQVEALNWLESVAAEPAHSGHLLAALIRSPPRGSAALEAAMANRCAPIPRRFHRLAAPRCGLPWKRRR
jgi:hypothetical protein